MLFEALCRSLASVYETTPLGISLEIQEIDPDMSYKQNNLHEYVARREGARP